MSCIAIITARGGSKRIPQKNIKLFCGKPIIAYSIEAAIESGLFDEIMVSTDSEDIKKVAESYGAVVPFMRSDEASNDYATTADVIKEVLGRYEEINRGYGTFCCIYPTAPFITGSKLREAHKMFTDQNADSVVPVVAFSYPPQRGFYVNDGILEYVQPEYALSRSQDLKRIYHDSGQFYFCRSDSFKIYKSLIMKKTIPYIVSEEEVQDIDNESDWKLAEIKYMRFTDKRE